MRCVHCRASLAAPMYGASTVMCSSCGQYNDVSQAMVPLEQRSLSPERPWWNSPKVLVVPLLGFPLALWITGMPWGLIVVVFALVVGSLIWTWLFH